MQNMCNWKTKSMVAICYSNVVFSTGSTVYRSDTNGITNSANANQTTHVTMELMFDEPMATRIINS